MDKDISRQRVNARRRVIALGFQIPFTAGAFIICLVLLTEPVIPFFVSALVAVLALTSTIVSIFALRAQIRDLKRAE